MSVSYVVLFVVKYFLGFLFLIFFFQAEDGIRDLVRSRGLGDVYKRQTATGLNLVFPGIVEPVVNSLTSVAARVGSVGGEPVSYTHLTLPTSDLV